MYELTRDGFSFLVMGFTGKNAARFKEDYIRAFKPMNAYLYATFQTSIGGGVLWL